MAQPASQPRLSPTITDARGNLVPLTPNPTRADWRRFGWWRRTRRVNDAGEPWVTELRIGTLAASWYGSSGGLLFVLTGPLAHRYFYPSFSGFPGVLAQLIPSLLVGFIAWPLFPVINANFRRKYREEIAAAYLSVHHCPSCNYSLRDIRPEPDGVIICPECGAAGRPALTASPTD